MNLPLVSILTQMNPAHTLRPYYSFLNLFRDSIQRLIKIFFTFWRCLSVILDLWVNVGDSNGCGKERCWQAGDLNTFQGPQSDWAWYCRHDLVVLYTTSHNAVHFETALADSHVFAMRVARCLWFANDSYDDSVRRMSSYASRFRLQASTVGM